MKNQILAGDFPKNAQINLVLGSVHTRPSKN